MTQNHDTVTWEVWNKTKVVFVKNRFRIGKYHFIPNHGNFNPEEYLKLQQEASNYLSQLKPPLDEEKQKKYGEYHKFLFGNPNLKFSISWEVDPKQSTPDEEFEKEINLILSLLTLETDIPFEVGNLNYYSPSTRDGYTRALMNPVHSNIRELDENSAKNALVKLENLKNLDDMKKNQILKALEWFIRGTQESDMVNSFANFWLGFEALSYWFGEGSPWKCQKCGTEIYKSSIRARGKEFLKKLNIRKYDFDCLYEARNDLFHRINPPDPQKRIDLGYLLKESIIGCLNSTDENLQV